MPLVVVARLSQLDILLPAHSSPADETVALLDFYSAATIAMAGPRFFGFVIGKAGYLTFNLTCISYSHVTIQTGI